MMGLPRMAAALVLLLSSGRTAGAQPHIRLESVAPGFASPVDIQVAGDQSGRLFVVERMGTIRIFDGAQTLAAPFADLSSRVLCCGERGLLGLAFHPEYAENGYFYVYYTVRNPDPQKLPGASDGDSVVARYQVSDSNPNVADFDSELVLLTIPQPFSNHNGGQIQFGPDGYLYVATGDGGSGGDPQNHGQNLGSLLGKILRVDVDAGTPYSIPVDNPFVSNPNAADEIWSYGLRNPWRFSFDRATGDMLIADVGQGSWEEVNFQTATSQGGENYGWRCREGAHDYNTSGCGGKTFVDPIVEYSHAQGCSITGGYRYRGFDFPELLGAYFYGDYCSGTIWGAFQTSSGWSARELLASGLSISTFGEDEQGEIYVADLGGTLYRIVVTAADGLGVDFGDRGTWINGLYGPYGQDSWSSLTNWDPVRLTAWNRSLAVSFAGRGLHAYDVPSGWQELTRWEPFVAVDWQEALVAGFDSGRGLWSYETGVWTRITNWTPDSTESVVAWGEKLAIDFGQGRGLWLYGSGSWQRIASWDPELLVTRGGELVVSFGSSRGLWRYAPTGWEQLSSWAPYALAQWNGDLAAAFDSGRGIYRYHDGAWQQLTNWQPVEMVPVGSSLAVTFGSSRGVWTYMANAWNQLTPWDAFELEALGSELVADFGPGRGIWHHDLADVGWTRWSSTPSEGLVAVDLN